MTNSTSSKLVGGTLWLTGSFVLARATQLIAQVFLARLLSPEDFGVWAMVAIITLLTNLFRDKATASVLVQRGIDDPTLVNAVYSLTINISVVIFVLQSLAGYPLSQFFGVPEVFPLTVCAATVFLLGAGAGSHGAILQRQMKFRELAISETGAGVARFGTAVVCAACGLGVWSFAIAEVAMSIVDATLKRWFSKYRFRYALLPDAEAVRNVRGYISKVVSINLAVYANTNGDNFLIGRLLGAQSLGYYNLAYQLAMLPLFAVSQINQVNFSALSQRDDDSKQHYAARACEMYALLFAPLYGIAYMTAPWLIPLVYGAEWLPAVMLFQLILIYAYARGFMSILGTALNSMNKPGVNAAINWALVPVSVTAFWLGIQWNGLTGVAIAVALVMGIAATAWFWMITCWVSGWNILRLARPVLLPTITVVGSILLLNRSPSSSLMLQVLQPIGLLLIYALVLSVLSAGRIPNQVIRLGKRALNLS